MDERSVEVERVFSAWRDQRAAWLERRADAGVGSGQGQAPRLTVERVKLIRAALRDYSADDLICLLDYAFNADEGNAPFWRGESRDSNGSTYVGLDNLFRKTKIDDRIDRATEWATRTERSTAPCHRLPMLPRPASADAPALPFGGPTSASVETEAPVTSIAALRAASRTKGKP